MVDPIHSEEAAEATEQQASLAALVDRIERCVKDISLAFDRWDDPLARGPGLYFVVEQSSLEAFASPMGANRWPVEDCPSVYADLEQFLAAAQSVSLAADGAVVVHADGDIEAAMVRVSQLTAAEYPRIDDLPYADWMGARHMSALETSTRDEVAAAITLSEEDGRVTVFRDGGFHNTTAGSL